MEKLFLFCMLFSFSFLLWFLFLLPATDPTAVILIFVVFLVSSYFTETLYIMSKRVNCFHLLFSEVK